MDKRLVQRLSSFREDIKDSQTAIIRQLAPKHKDQIAYYRLLSNEELTEQRLIENLQVPCKKEAKNKHVLIISDSTDMDYSRLKNRIKPNSGLGYIGNGDGCGYNCHASLVVDAESAAVYGLSDVYLWERKEKVSVYRKLLNAEKQLSEFKKKKKNKTYPKLSWKRKKICQNIQLN